MKCFFKIETSFVFNRFFKVKNALKLYFSKKRLLDKRKLKLNVIGTSSLTGFGIFEGLKWLEQEARLFKKKSEKKVAKVGITTNIYFF